MNVRDVPIRYENSDPWRMEQHDLEEHQHEAEAARRRYRMRVRQQDVLLGICRREGHVVPVRLRDRPLYGPYLCQRCGVLLQDGKNVGEEKP